MLKIIVRKYTFAKLMKGEYQIFTVTSRCIIYSHESLESQFFRQKNFGFHVTEYRFRRRIDGKRNFVDSEFRQNKEFRNLIPGEFQKK